jgi:hypothetical protein
LRNFSQRLRVSQLAEQHRNELRPTAEASRVPLCLVFRYRSVKLSARDELQ